MKDTRPSDFGINLLGQFSSSTGLGITARQTARGLMAAGVPLLCHDLSPYYQTSRDAEELRAFDRVLVRDPEALGFPVNVFCIPPIDIPQVIAQVPGLMSADRYQTAIIWWETTKLHPQWQDHLSRLDAVIAFSDFVAEVLGNTVPLTPVIRGKQAFFLPNGILPDRKFFGIPEDVTVFFNSFDPSSDPARKNPAAVISAFCQAFPTGSENVMLIFRLNNAQATAMAAGTTQALVEYAKADRRIRFVLAPMSYREVLTLCASVDVYVSLHRAEGLGLGMLEAMRLGVPVVATDWSGNMSYMNQDSACLVRHRQTEPSGNHPFYRRETLGEGAIWAEPLIEDAIAWMRHLHTDRTDRHRFGQAASRCAQQFQDQAMEMRWVDELALLWQRRALLPKVKGKFRTPL